AFARSIRVLTRIAHDTRTLLALQQRLDGAVRQPQELNHRTKRPNHMDVVRAGLRDAGILLGGQQNRLLGGFSSLQRLNRLLPSDKDCIDLVGKTMSSRRGNSGTV